MANRIGQQFGNYRLTRLLGTGGFAEVYLGEHIHLGTLAAIKVLQTQLNRREEQGFQNEARMVARLIHPHIVRVLEFGIQGKVPFLVMDYAPYGTLRDRHPRGTILPLSIIVPYVRQIADALEFAHEDKLIHRDIKPENILIGSRREILLSDFGIAIVAHSTRSQRTEDIIGTLDYMAPEQIQAHPQLASDQYALAALVYEWLCGLPPFIGTVSEVIAKHLHTPPQTLRSRDATIPPLVEYVVLKALEKDISKRFARITAFANALEQATILSTTGTKPIPAVSAYVAPPLSPYTVANSGTSRVPAGTVLYTYRGHKDHIHAVAWCPDRKRIASAGVDGKVRVWDASNGKESCIFKHPGYIVNTLAWSSDGRYLASGGEDGSVQIWDATSNATKAVAIFTASGSPISALAWAPNGQHLIFGYTDGKIALRSLDLRLNIDARASSSITALAWSPDGNYVTYADVSGIVQIYTVVINDGDDEETDEEDDYEDDYENDEQNQPASSSDVTLVYNKYYAYNEWVNALSWSSDSKHLLAAGEEGAAEIWDVHDDEAEYASIVYTGHTDTVRTATWSPNRKRVATAGDDMIVQVWNVSDGHTVFTYTGHSEAVRSVAWSPDRKRIASAGEDNTVQVWTAP